MRLADTTAIGSPPELALIAHVPASRLPGVIPVALEPLDPFAEAEPSRGATIELASGGHVVVVYGLVTERLFVHAAAAQMADAIEDFLQETGLPAESIAWRLPASLRPVPAGALR